MDFVRTRAMRSCSYMAVRMDKSAFRATAVIDRASVDASTLATTSDGKPLF